jgi:hypothetical protein
MQMLTCGSITPADEESVEDGTNPDILRLYGPPFDLTSDMLFVAALAPADPLRRAFPGVPFLALAGRIPLLMWFSRIKQACFQDGAGQTRCLGGPESVLYNELNVLALLRRPAMFVPGIYATSPLTIRLGRRYGMPKQPATMGLATTRRQIASRVIDGGRQRFVRARLLGSGEGLGGIVTRFWPWSSIPVRFPDGRQVRARILATPRVQLARVRGGRLSLDAAWLPRPLPLLPLGIYVPDQRMQLPPPDDLRWSGTETPVIEG